MTFNKFVPLVCLLLCVIRTAYSTAAVGATCANNAGCLTTGYCGSDLKCACGSTYTGATCTAVAITTGVCTATGGQCGAIANAYCDSSVASPVCKCGAAFDVSAATCVGKDCTAGVTVCTTADPNTECDTNKCKCKATYGMFARGTQSKCQLGVGGACTATGTQCANLPGGYCNTAAASPVCACGAIYDAVASSCALKVCDRGSTTCATADPNSECGPGYCICKSGYSIGSDGKCSTNAAMPGAIISMVTLIGCLLFAKIN